MFPSASKDFEDDRFVNESIALSFSCLLNRAILQYTASGVLT
jgi:hypothetical protein